MDAATSHVWPTGEYAPKCPFCFRESGVHRPLTLVLETCGTWRCDSCGLVADGDDLDALAAPIHQDAMTDGGIPR